jgi:CubicO group peptidase (beta-lactamase class C family)
MVLGIVTEDGLAFSKGWGVTDVFAKLEDQVPVTPDHVFRIGSISKLFTDIAVMRLVEAGKVDLDVPVATYVYQCPGSSATQSTSKPCRK